VATRTIASSSRRRVGVLAQALCDHSSMSEPPVGAAGSALDETEETYCYGHPNTPTKLRCSRCGRPICGRCAIPASVGQHCPECVAEARRSVPRVRSAMAAAAPAVTTILIVNAAFFVLQYLIPELLFRLALVPRAIADGEWWRLFTPMVLHAGGFHILMNSLVLWIYGPHVEAALGTVRFVALYVIAGFIGSVASFTFSSPFIVGVGASGAIFGVAGALLVYLYRRRNLSFVYAEMRNVMFFVGLNLALGFVIPRIDYWAHIGGLAAGMLLCLGLDREGRSARSLALLTSGVVVAAGVAMAAVRSAELGGALLG
jgi:membrane associated rhomboid family serine protease